MVPLKKETSAGGVAYRVTAEGSVEIVMLRRREDKKWVLPKGHVEQKYRDNIHAARDEIDQEVGLTDLSHEAELGTSIHHLSFPGERVEKTVYFFLFQAKPDACPVLREPEHYDKVAWVTFDEATSCQLRYPNDLQVLIRARERVQQTPRSR